MPLKPTKRENALIPISAKIKLVLAPHIHFCLIYSGMFSEGWYFERVFQQHRQGKTGCTLHAQVAQG